jgi:hypothetical protein
MNGWEQEPVERQAHKKRGFGFVPNPLRVGELLLGGRFLNCDIQHLPAAVLAAVGTNPVRQHRLVAVAALGQLGNADGIVGTAAVAAALAKFSLW